jgi:AcrR family transcriptional regulator
VAEHGLSAEMKAIAERAGIGVGTVYRNFATKSELLASLVDQLLAENHAVLDDAERADDPVAMIRRLFDNGCGLMERYGNIIHALVVQGSAVSFADESVAEMFEERLRRILARGVESGAIRADSDVEFLANYIHSSFPVAYLQLRKRYSADEVRRKLADLLFDGMLARG